MTAFTVRMQYHIKEPSCCNKARKNINTQRFKVQKYNCIFSRQYDLLNKKNPKEPPQKMYRTYQNTTIKDF